jgi:hypothetical protein
MGSSLALYREVVTLEFEGGTLLTVVYPHDRISAPCGVSLSIVEHLEFLLLPYRVRCSTRMSTRRYLPFTFAQHECISDSPYSTLGQFF